MAHVINQQIVVEAIMLGLDDAAASPDDVAFVVEDPSANSATYTLALSSEVTEFETGRIYRCAFTADEAGVWNVRAEAHDSSDNVIGAAETTATVTATLI